MLPFLDSNIIVNGLKHELDGSIPDGVSVNASKLDWWKNHFLELPQWSSACRATTISYFDENHIIGNRII